MEEQGEAHRLALLLGDHRLGRSLAEQGVTQALFGGFHRVRLAFELGQFADEAQDQRDVLRRRGTDGQGQNAASTVSIDRRRAAIRQPVMISAAPASV